ncbi:MAG: hypothetical protein PUC99_00635 [Eubacteriales bacterium]|nr:hypothetical protein [Eubacteriales bacterium]
MPTSMLRKSEDPDEEPDAVDEEPDTTDPFDDELPDPHAASDIAITAASPTVTIFFASMYFFLLVFAEALSASVYFKLICCLLNFNLIIASAFCPSSLIIVFYHPFLRFVKSL